MSKIQTRPMPPDYTGRWNHDRFLVACEAARVPVGHHSAARILADLVTAWRRTRGLDGEVQPAVARRWLSGVQDPSMGAAGRYPSAYDLAGALAVSLDWLMTGEVKP